ncbi:MAG: PfkB family carbohydrate kinase [Phycisphaerae bacterium]|nr:PfkB family carbohydrate kinase [Phycisphaerae bacterium]
MSLLVTGSIGIDTVESPFGRVVDTLGGSSIYFAYAASFFSPVRLVGVVGEDCPADFLAPLHANERIDMGGLEIRRGSKTFRWHGRYHQDVNIRDTVGVELNVLAERGPTIPESFRDSRYVFLANTHPALQIELLGQLRRPALVVADTMDLWIQTERETLMKLIDRLDGLVLNDGEAKMLTGESNVVAAGLELGTRVRNFIVIKKGEHGALLFTGRNVFALPSYPTFCVVDPTGAGDSFAGAMMGYLASQDNTDAATLRRAMAYGTVTASIGIEGFSLQKFFTASRDAIDRRMGEFEEMITLTR